MNTSHVFPQGVLAAVTLVGDEAEDGGARARARCELGLLLFSVSVITLSGVRAGPKLLEQKPCGSGSSSLTSQHQDPHPRGKKCSGKRVWCVHSVWVWARAVMVHQQTEIGTASDSLPVYAPVLALLKCSFGSDLPLSLTAGFSLWPLPLSP